MHVVWRPQSVRSLHVSGFSLQCHEDTHDHVDVCTAHGTAVECSHAVRTPLTKTSVSAWHYSADPSRGATRLELPTQRQIVHWEATAVDWQDIERCCLHCGYWCWRFSNRLCLDAWQSTEHSGTNNLLRWCPRIHLGTPTRKPSRNRPLRWLARSLAQGH